MRRSGEVYLTVFLKPVKGSRGETFDRAEWRAKERRRRKQAAAKKQQVSGGS